MTLAGDPPTIEEAEECRTRRITLPQLRAERVTAAAEPDPAQLEDAERREVVRVYRAFGCLVYNLSQPRRAKYLTPGLPDLWIVHRGSGRAWWHEAKRPVGGRYSGPQLEFRDGCATCRVDWVGGDRRDAQERLVAIGVAEWGPGGTLEPVRR
jgi:hypothetical protein